MSPTRALGAYGLVLAVALGGGFALGAAVGDDESPTAPAVVTTTTPARPGDGHG